MYSDRTAGCHYRRFGFQGEREKVRKKKLAPAEYEDLGHILDDPELPSINEMYGRCTSTREPRGRDFFRVSSRR